MSVASELASGPSARLRVLDMPWFPAFATNVEEGTSPLAKPLVKFVAHSCCLLVRAGWLPKSVVGVPIVGTAGGVCLLYTVLVCAPCWRHARRNGTPSIEAQVLLSIWCYGRAELCAASALNVVL